MIFTIVALLIAGGHSAIPATQSPYTGEEANLIKSLNPVEINGLMQGKGMGFAKVAELNHYPGPRHVLDMADQLQLSSQQIAQTNRIFDNMREHAIVLGEQLVSYETKLDSLFASGQVAAAELDSLLLLIGKTRAQLRGVHLHAHLEMKKVLNHHQIMMYDTLRGYSNGSHQDGHAH